MSTTFTWQINEKIDAEKRETLVKSGSGKKYIKKQLKTYLDKNPFLDAPFLMTEAVFFTAFFLTEVFIFHKPANPLLT